MYPNMSPPNQIPHFTLLLLPLLLLITTTTTTTAINITALLTPYPTLTEFSNLLTTTAVSSDLTSRTSITLLAVSNTYLSATPHPPSTTLPDTLRYHILLQYLTLDDLHNIPPSGKQVTTLFQTTGRATTSSGTVNITYSPETDTVTFYSPTSNATLLSSITTSPYNISILSLNSLLIPYNVDLMASETRPPLGLNITKALIDGHDFNVAASMLSASGVVSEFENAATGAGITLFIPTDEAFADLPSSVRFQSLPAENKAIVLRFHVLHSYYPLGTLEDIVNPTYPTLATEQNGAGSFTLNLSRVNGTLSIGTGLVQAFVTQTVFDQKPVAIFGVSKVLLPREYFGKNPIQMNVPPVVMGTAQPPDGAYSPGNSPPNHLSAAPPGMDVRSAAAVSVSVLRLLGLCCIGLCYSLL